MNELNEYTLWLMPEKEHFLALQSFIAQSAEESHTIPFLPHITLLGGIHESEESCIEKTHRLAEEAAPLTLTMIGIERSDLYYRSLYVRFESQPSLQSLFEKAEALFVQTPKEYMPHMSLLYGEVSEELKERTKNLFKGLYPLETLTVDSLALFHAKGPANEWKLIAEVPLV